MPVLPDACGRAAPRFHQLPNGWKWFSSCGPCASALDTEVCATVHLKIPLGWDMALHQWVSSPRSGLVFKKRSAQEKLVHWSEMSALTQRRSGILKKLKCYSSFCSASFFVILLFLHLRDLFLSLSYFLFFLFYLFVFVLSFFLICLFYLLFSLLFLRFLIPFTILIFLSFLKPCTKCLL